MLKRLFGQQSAEESAAGGPKDPVLNRFKNISPQSRGLYLPRHNLLSVLASLNVCRQNGTKG